MSPEYYERIAAFIKSESRYLYELAKKRQLEIDAIIAKYTEAKK